MPTPTTHNHRFDLADLPAVNMPAASIRPFSTENFTVVFAQSSAGTALPEHSHPHEQLTVVESGRMRVTVDGGEPFEVGPRQIVHFPSNVPHTVEVIEDCVAFDVFSPVNHDLMARAAAAQSDLGYGS
jgi:quercetin dioxygenase-like cupin family protein